MLSTGTENVQKDYVPFVQYQGREEENQGFPTLVYGIFGVWFAVGFLKSFKFITLLLKNMM